VRPSIWGVVFDLDGLLLDSEQVWDEARKEFVRTEGGHWNASATRDMMGMSSPEWSRYLHERLGVPLTSAEISAAVVERVSDALTGNLPLFPGAKEAVLRMSERWPLGLASSSNRVVIDRVLELAGLTRAFSTTVSSEEVAHGKPAPDVYLRATQRLRLDPRRCVAVEDSTNGVLSASAAGLRVVAIPNREFPPAPGALERADLRLASISELSPETVERRLTGALVTAR
jgi:HAD superfamily hydrolase (TIGR01509 family)